MLRTTHNGDLAYPSLAFVCPGCASLKDNGTGLHLLPVNTDKTSPAWTFDGNEEAPTVSPSILTHTAPYVNGKPTGICHSFLKAGVFEFLGDCTHQFVNQKVSMPDLPKWFTHEDDENEEKEG